MCKAIQDLMADSRQEGIEKGIEKEALDNARELLKNGVSFEIVRRSIHNISDEKLQEVYDEVKSM